MVPACHRVWLRYSSASGAGKHQLPLLYYPGPKAPPPSDLVDVGARFSLI